GGVDYRPANAGAYLPEADLGKLKTIFWRYNIKAFAPILETTLRVSNPLARPNTPNFVNIETRVIGTWIEHKVPIPDGSTYVTGIDKTNPWWHVQGHWFQENSMECVVGAKLAKRLGVSAGSTLLIWEPVENKNNVPQYLSQENLSVVGVLETGSDEDEAIVVPLDLAQQIA